MSRRDQRDAEPRCFGRWYGLLVPTGTPNEVISRVHAESTKALKRQDVKERLDTAGVEPIGTTPEQFGAHIRSEIDKWAKPSRVVFSSCQPLFHAAGAFLPLGPMR